MPSITYQEALDFIFKQTPMYTRDGSGAYKPGLQNINYLCRLIGNPQQQFKSIHIAGTNGKGSTSHIIAAVLQEAGYTTGLYTSPHLQRFTERIKVNGAEMDTEFLVSFIQTHYEALIECKASFFEITTALAFLYFAEKGVDFAVIETGLGGRLDATNILKPEISVITNIGWDHMDLLGNTLDAIAFEKAGIIKPNTPVVISEVQEDPVHQVFTERAKNIGAPLYTGTQIRVESINPYATPMPIQIYVPEASTPIEAQSGLSGPFQLKNLQGAIRALLLLREAKSINFTNVNLTKALLEVSVLNGLKGRWQTLINKPLLIVDGAHNYEGFKQNMLQLEALAATRYFLVLGFSKDKEIARMLHCIPKHCTVIATQFDSQRTFQSADLINLLKNEDITVFKADNVQKGIDLARSMASDTDVIFVGGSLYLIGEIDFDRYL